MYPISGCIIIIIVTRADMIWPDKFYVHSTIACLYVLSTLVASVLPLQRLQKQKDYRKREVLAKHIRSVSKSVWYMTDRKMHCWAMQILVYELDHIHG